MSKSDRAYVDKELKRLGYSGINDKRANASFPSAFHERNQLDSRTDKPLVNKKAKSKNKSKSSNKGK